MSFGVNRSIVFYPTQCQAKEVYIYMYIFFAVFTFDGLCLKFCSYTVLATMFTSKAQTTVAGIPAMFRA